MPRRAPFPAAASVRSDLGVQDASHISFFFLARLTDLNPPLPVRPPFLAQVGGDYDFLLSVARNEFLRTAREQVARCISVASDALASASGAPDKDSSRRRSFQTEAASASSLAFEAHSLKGAASTIHADAIADACSRLERAARAVMKARRLGNGSEGDGAFFRRADALGDARALAPRGSAPNSTRSNATSNG